MQEPKVKMQKLKRKIQKKKGDLKMNKMRFYLPTLFCAALLCLGTTSYVKAEEDATSREHNKALKRDHYKDLKAAGADARVDAVHQRYQNNQNKGKKALGKYDDYYDREKFDSLAGNDGVITQEDWQNNRTSKEAKFFGDARWDQAVKFDADGDGALDIDEAKAYKQAERQKLIDNKGKVKHAYENRKWLENHPRIAAKLANNPEWLKKHPQVAKKLFGNKKWLAAHPKAAQAMRSNKQWVKNHPKIAKEIYNNKKFLAKHPGIAKRVDRRQDRRQDRRIDRRNKGRINKGVRDHGKGLGRGKGRGGSQRKARTHNKGGGRRSGGRSGGRSRGRGRR